MTKKVVRYKRTFPPLKNNNKKANRINKIFQRHMLIIRFLM